MLQGYARSAFWVLERHHLAARGFLAEAVLLGLAAVVITLWHNALANVVFGLLVVFAAALALVMLIVGASIQLQKLRHARAD